jgi:hypothetical protein
MAGRVVSVRFYCIICGDRAWTLPAEVPEEERLIRAIAEEAAWHARNMELHGSLFPQGVEPMFGSPIRLRKD